jgi:hypothetical protein
LQTLHTSQAVSAPGNWQAPVASHVPPQLRSPAQSPRGSLPTGTMHVPPPQNWQRPLHAESQHTPSTQCPLWHARSATHAMAIGSAVEHIPALQ